jgi:hypothetical protein
MAKIYEQSRLMEEMSKNAFNFIFEEYEKLKKGDQEQKEIQEMSYTPIVDNSNNALVFP